MGPKSKPYTSSCHTGSTLKQLCSCNCNGPPIWSRNFVRRDWCWRDPYGTKVRGRSHNVSKHPLVVPKNLLTGHKGWEYIYRLKYSYVLQVICLQNWTCVDQDSEIGTQLFFYKEQPNLKACPFISMIMVVRAWALITYWGSYTILCSENLMDNTTILLTTRVCAELSE